jgi:beta-lactam-binding protein with PASTA domain
MLDDKMSEIKVTRTKEITVIVSKTAMQKIVKDWVIENYEDITENAEATLTFEQSEETRGTVPCIKITDKL